MSITKQFSIVFLFVFSFAAQVCSQNSHEYKNERNEILQAWEDYVVSLDRISGQVEITMYATDGLDFSSTRRFRLVYPYLSIEHLGEKGDVTFRRNFNSDYMFSLKYETPEPVIGEINLIQRSKNWFDSDHLLEEINEESTKNAILLLVGGPLRLFPFWLPSLLKSDQFIITGVEYQNFDGQTIAEISFKNHQPICENPKMNLLEGKLSLLPDKFYLPVKAEAVIEDADDNGVEEYHLTIENDYDFSFDPPVLREQKRVTAGTKQSGEGRIFISDLEKIPSVDKTEFTLSHYGFPEPSFAEEAINPARVILIILGVLIILRAVFPIHSKRRESAR